MSPGQRGLLVQLGLLDRKVPRVFKAQADPRVRPVPQVRPALLVPKVRRGLPAFRGPRGKLGRRVRLEQLGRRVRRATRAPLVQLDLPGRRGILDLPVLPAPMALRVLRLTFRFSPRAGRGRNPRVDRSLMSG